MQVLCCYVLNEVCVCHRTNANVIVCLFLLALSHSLSHPFLHASLPGSQVAVFLFVHGAGYANQSAVYSKWPHIRLIVVDAEALQQGFPLFAEQDKRIIAAAFQVRKKYCLIGLRFRLMQHFIHFKSIKMRYVPLIYYIEAFVCGTRPQSNMSERAVCARCYHGRWNSADCSVNSCLAFWSTSLQMQEDMVIKLHSNNRNFTIFAI